MFRLFLIDLKSCSGCKCLYQSKVLKEAAIVVTATAVIHVATVAGPLEAESCPFIAFAIGMRCIIALPYPAAVMITNSPDADAEVSFIPENEADFLLLYTACPLQAFTPHVAVLRL